MQAITTKYLGATNHRSSRVVARAQACNITLPWDHALNAEQNHRAAAMALAAKLGWRGTWHGGGLPDSKGYAFVCAAEGSGFDVQ